MEKVLNAMPNDQRYKLTRFVHFLSRDKKRTKETSFLKLFSSFMQKKVTKNAPTQTPWAAYGFIRHFIRHTVSELIGLPIKGKT